MDHVNFLSIDVEDWFHSGYLKDYADQSNLIYRINDSVDLILNLFEKYNCTATFFVLGEIAERHPELIDKIDKKGHEIASHGYDHTPLWDLNPDSFKEQLLRTNDAVQQITNKKIIGFRAPYASLDEKTNWAIDVLEELDFKYDSSIFPMKTPIYGLKNAPLDIYKISSEDISKHSDLAKIVEVPFTVYQKSLFKIPCTGGIYGRFLPSLLLNKLLKSTNKKRPINFYFHPWEIDSDIPKIKAPILNKLISYYNVNNYLSKIEHILKNFNFNSFETNLKAKKYIN